MEYQETINLWANTQYEPSKFRTRNWVEINDESRGTYDKDNQIGFKMSMLRSNLCHYSDAYTRVSGTIAIKQEEVDDAAKRADEMK